MPQITKSPNLRNLKPAQPKALPRSKSLSNLAKPENNTDLAHLFNLNTRHEVQQYM